MVVSHPPTEADDDGVSIMCAIRVVIVSEHGTEIREYSASLFFGETYAGLACCVIGLGETQLQNRNLNT